jgi:uncharacterized protein (TIGR03545 family)
MIRWAYLVPRLVLVGIVVLVVWLTFDPLLRFMTIHTGQAVTLAKWDIDEAMTSLWQQKVGFVGVQVADPRSPMKNLFQADEIALAVESRPLTQRCLVVKEGRVSGLRFNTDRTTSGEVDPLFRLQWQIPALPQIDIDEQLAANVIDRWLQKLLPLLSQEAAREIEQLESVKLAKELMERWPAEYARMENHAEQLKVRIEQLRASADAQPADPVQQIEHSSKIVAEVDRIVHDLEQFALDMERLKQQAVRDKEAVVVAQKHDAERIRDIFRAENLSPEAMTEYLLRRELGDRVLTIARWIGIARQHIPHQVEDAKPIRMRGEDIVFRKARKYPDVLLRSLAIDGDAAIENEQFHFAGVLTDVTSHPEMVGKPTVIRLQLQGRAAVRVEAVVDQTGPKPRQRVILDCPALPQPERTLGNPDQLAVTISPGNTYWWILLDLTGDDLSGQIQVQQTPVRITPKVTPQFGGASLAASLQAGANQLQSLEAIVDLGGTVTRPTWKIRSDLGPKLVAAIDTAIRHELDARSVQFVAAVNQRLQADLGNFDRMLQSRCDAVAAKHNLRRNEIQQLGRVVAARVPGLANLPDAVKNQPGVQQFLNAMPKTTQGNDRGTTPAINALKLF